MRNEFTGEATRFSVWKGVLRSPGSLWLRKRKLRDRGKIGGENSEDEKKKGGRGRGIEGREDEQGRGEERA